MDSADYIMLSWAVLLFVLGLVFAASGFGVIVAGRLDGFVLVMLGLTMFWAGWLVSRARGAWCALAAVLNMFDAASTFVFWNFEANPFVLAIGPTMFMAAKITCSLAIMLYAKFHSNPTKGGIMLAFVFALIVVWNLSQHLLVYFGLRDFAYGVFLGTIFSFAASIAALCAHLKRSRNTHGRAIQAKSSGGKTENQRKSNRFVRK